MPDAPEKDEKKSNSSERELICSRISRITDLPVPPVVMAKLFAILQDQTVLPPDFESSLLAHDPSIIAFLLKNLYEQPECKGKIFGGVGELIQTLGPEEMYILLSEMTPMDEFSPEETIEWKHAYSTHLMMHELIEENGFNQLKHLGIVMLLHDIGKLVLNRVSPKAFQAARKQAWEEKIPAWSFEKQLMKIDHAEVGGRLLAEWKFPEEYIKPVFYHHCEGVPPDYVLETALVQFVDWVDCSIRKFPGFPVHKDIMNAAGIESIDSAYWLDRQREIVERTDKEFKPDGVMYSDTNSTFMKKDDPDAVWAGGQI